MFDLFMLMRKIIKITSFLIFTGLCLAQNNNVKLIDGEFNFINNIKRTSLVSYNSLNSKTEIGKDKINLGIQAGFHSTDLSENGSLNFDGGFYLESYLGYNLSYEVQAIIAFSYWEGQTDQNNSASFQTLSQTVISKALKMELDFALFNIYSVKVFFGPSISIENINTANETVFTLGANLKFKIPLTFINEKLRLAALVNYQAGAESFNFGGGKNYSFFGYLLGAEIGI